MDRKQPRWEKAQSLMHKENRERFQQENVFGRIKYEEKENGRKGFVMEAKEAPGTPLHRGNEKHLNKMEKVSMKRRQFLYASGMPFRNQAVFYDVTEWHRSREFLQCMKEMMEEYGHRTLKEAFGFLNQGPERSEKRALMEEREGMLTLEEFGSLNRELDLADSRLRKKEAMERQLCGELQLMIDREKEQQGRKKEPDFDPGRREIFPIREQEEKGRQEGGEDREAQGSETEVQGAEAY